MEAKDVYQRAWIKLYEEITKGKTSWGKLELKDLMLKCFIELDKEVSK